MSYIKDYYIYTAYIGKAICGNHYLSIDIRSLELFETSFVNPNIQHSIGIIYYCHNSIKETLYFNLFGNETLLNIQIWMWDKYSSWFSTHVIILDPCRKSFRNNVHNLRWVVDVTAPLLSSFFRNSYQHTRFCCLAKQTDKENQ